MSKRPIKQPLRPSAEFGYSSLTDIQELMDRGGQLITADNLLVYARDLRAAGMRRVSVLFSLDGREVRGTVAL